MGVSTLSMTWITPLLASTSAPVTVASLTITVVPTVNDSGLLFSASADIQSVTADDGTVPETT